jgi:hypothetical protein
MKSLSSWGLKSIDYFSQPMQITFNQKRNFSTVLGGFLSLVIYCVTITLVISSANNLLNKVNPKSTMTESSLHNAPLLNVAEQNLIYVIGFLDRNFEPLYDDSLFTMEFSQFKREKQTDGNMLTRNIPLNKTNCGMYREEFKKRGFEREYLSNSIELAVCFDYKTPGLILGGNFNSDYFSNVNLKIKRCINSTNSKTICKSKDVIDDKLLNGYFQFHYYGNNIDINNYTNPYKISFSQYFIATDPKASKFVDVYFKTVNITTDAGIIFQSFDYESALVFDYYREQILVQVVDDLVVDFYINSSKNYLTYTRIYQKFQDFAANIGGLLKVMTVLGYFITIKFTHYAMYEKMFNCLYNFDYDGEQNGRKIENSSKSKYMYKTKIDETSTHKNLSINQNIFNTHLSGLYKNNYLNVAETAKPIHNSVDKEKSFNISNYDNYKTQIDREIKNQKKKYDKKFILDPVDVLKLYFCNCCSPKNKNKLNLFRLAFNKLHKYLDYLQIVQTLQQFHRLKKVIFTKTQKKLFLLHSKPLISENKKIFNDEDGRKSMIEGSDENKIIYENYLKAKKKEGSNKIYKRLLKNLDENLKKIFENIKN